MWLYIVPKDVTRSNAADLTDRELLDEVRRLTHFSQEDSISLVSVQVPFELRRLPAKVIFVACLFLHLIYRSYSILMIFLCFIRPPPS
jgi:hypothetical protein